MSFPFPSLFDLIPEKKSVRARLAFLPKTLNMIALALLLLSFTDPYIPLKGVVKEQIFTEGIAIYLVLDHSGSMMERIETGITKFDLLKQTTRQFIEARPSDLIGVNAFARTTQVLAPLTLDHAEVLEKLDSLTKVPNIDQEGTAIGYAIYKTANLISATRHFAEEKGGYAIKDAIMILITDGFQDPNPLDIGNKQRTMGLEDAARFAKEQNVKLYIINVEPKITAERFTAQRNVLEKAAKLTGGKLFLASNPKTLGEVYEEINRLQKSQLPGLVQVEKFYLYPYLIALGMGLLLLALLLDTTYLRRAP